MFLALVAALFSACLPGEDTFNSDDWRPEIAIPLFHAEFGLEDVLKQFEGESPVISDSNRLLHIIYEGEVFSLSGEDLFVLPSLAGPIAASSGSLSTVFPGVGTIYQVDFKSGILSFELNATESGPIELTLSLPELKLGNNSFQFDTLFTGPANFQKQISLQGYRLLSPQATVTYTYQCKKQATGDPVQLTGLIQFENVAYAYIEGLLDPITTETKVDTIDIDLFDNQAAAVLKFQDFDLDLIFRNSIGLPIRGNMKQLKAITNNAGTLAIGSGALQNGVDFAYPSLMEVGDTKNTSVNLNASNSNLGVSITNGPTKIIYQVGAETLPMTESGFMTDSSRFAVDLRLDLPLFLTADQFFLDQQRDFLVNDWGPIDKVEEASFRIQTENGYPVEVSMQLFLMDENGIIDSVFDGYQPVLAAAPVDADARVTEPAILNFDIDLPASRLEKLQRTRYLLVRLQAETLDNGNTPVRIFDDYTFVLKMGLKAKIDP